MKLMYSLVGKVGGRGGGLSGSEDEEAALEWEDVATAAVSRGAG